MQYQDISLIKGYHAHVYFDESTFEQAKALCEEAGKLFQVTVGRMHSQPVGPHPCWSCQLAFDSSKVISEKKFPIFGNMLDWELEENNSRCKLSG